MNKVSGSDRPDEIILPLKNADAKLKFTVAAELMKNHRPTSPLDPTTNIAVAQDVDGWPMIFTIGTDHKFHLLKMDSQAKGGFTLIDLSSAFGADLQANSFVLTQDNQGRISIVLTLSQKSGGETQVFVASRLSNDYMQTDWSKFQSLVCAVEGVDKTFIVEKTMMGVTDDHNPPVSIVAGSLNGHKRYYLIDNRQHASLYEFPENVLATSDSLQDISIGYAFGQTAIYFLYKIGQTQTLECTTLASEELGSLNYDYSAGNKNIPKPFNNLRYNCIDTPTGTRRDPFSICSDIYAGTQSGIYCFLNAATSKVVKVTDQLKDVHEITVVYDHQNISVWAMTAGNKLYYIRGRREATYTFDDPILFRDDVVHIAPMRNQVRKGNEIFIVCQDQSIRHYWQDPVTTLWKEQQLNVEHDEDFIEFNSFTTHINVSDQKGKPLVEQEVYLTSNEWGYVTINGLVYSLDKDSPATVKTDVMGNITIVSMTNSIAVPIYHLEADGLEHTLNIYPNGRIDKGLQAIGDGQDLKDAKTEDGKPVYDGKHDAATLDAVTRNLNQLTTAGSQLQDGSKPDQYTYVVVEPKGLMHSGKLDLSLLPDNLRVTFGNGLTIDQMNGSAVLQNIAGDALHYLERVAASAIKGIESGLTYLENGVSFVIQKVQDGLQLILNIADQVLSIVLDTLGAIYNAVNWLLKQIGIDLDKIIAWLGRLFGWTEILETSDKICDLMNNALDLTVATADTIKVQICDLLTRAEMAIAGPDIVHEFDGAGDSALGNTLSGLVNNPMANWGMYQLMHGGLIGLDGAKLPGITEKIETALGGLLDKEIFTTDKAVSMIEETLAHVNTDNIGETLARIGKILAVVAIEGTKHCLTAIIDLAGILLDVFKALMNTTLPAPLLRRLLKMIMGSRQFTLLRILSLVIAIPLRLAYRIVTGNSLQPATLQPVDVNQIKNIFESGMMPLHATPVNPPHEPDRSGPDADLGKTMVEWVVMYAIVRVFETGFATLSLIGPASDQRRYNISYTFSIAKAFMSLLLIVPISLMFAFGPGRLRKVKLEQYAFLVASIFDAIASMVQSACVSDGLRILDNPYPIDRRRANLAQIRRTRAAIAVAYLVSGVIPMTKLQEPDLSDPSERLRFASNVSLCIHKILENFGTASRPMQIAVGATGLLHMVLVCVRADYDPRHNVYFKFM